MLFSHNTFTTCYAFLSTNYHVQHVVPNRPAPFLQRVGKPHLPCSQSPQFDRLMPSSDSEHAIHASKLFVPVTKKYNYQHFRTPTLSAPQWDIIIKRINIPLRGHLSIHILIFGENAPSIAPQAGCLPSPIFKADGSMGVIQIIQYPSQSRVNGETSGYRSSQAVYIQDHYASRTCAAKRIGFWEDIHRQDTPSQWCPISYLLTAHRSYAQH
jgi:hypothetical protein